MERIRKTFEELGSRRQKAFIGYAMAGFPDAEGALALAEGLLDAGADILEIGVPFSDPLADGPVIQKASETALAGGTSLRSALELAKQLRARTGKPLVAMTYYNPVLNLGLEPFVDLAQAAGLDGAIIPDLPPEEAGPLAGLMKKRGLALILLAAPTSTPARMKKIAALASGFIYFVSVTGVTGEQKSFDSLLAGAVAGMRKASRLPIAIGFGVSDQARAREAAGLADGVVAASAILKPWLDTPGPEGLPRALEIARSLIQTVHLAGN